MSLPHVEGIHCRPERLSVFNQPPVEVVHHPAPTLAPGAGREDRARANFRGQILDVSYRGAAGDYEACDDVLELPHIPRPRIRAECCQGLGTDTPRGVVIVPATWFRKWSIKMGMSSLRSRSGGTMKVDYVQAIEEVLAKEPLGHHHFEVAIRRSNDAHVDCASVSVGADLLEARRFRETEAGSLASADSFR